MIGSEAEYMLEAIAKLLYPAGIESRFEKEPKESARLERLIWRPAQFEKADSFTGN